MAFSNDRTDQKNDDEDKEEKQKSQDDGSDKNPKRKQMDGDNFSKDDTDKDEKVGIPDDLEDLSDDCVEEILSKVEEHNEDVSDKKGKYVANKSTLLPLVVDPINWNSGVVSASHHQSENMSIACDFKSFTA
ncbi:hypothetical protein ABZP36_027724 [Zizania latifolia]